MTETELLQAIKSEPKSIDFNNVISVIDSTYSFTPAEFKNGSLNNVVGENSGSCKIFAFAQLHELTEEETLNCFGDYYRIDVLENLDGDNHQNIRNFMSTGWNGIVFLETPLTIKQTD